MGNELGADDLIEGSRQQMGVGEASRGDCSRVGEQVDRDHRCRDRVAEPIKSNETNTGVNWVGSST